VEIQNERETLLGILKLKMDAGAIFKKALPIIAPLLGSIVPGWI